MSTEIKLVKELRDRTNLAMNDCKKALEQSNNNIDAAIDLLKTWGELKGKEKANKIATEGKVWTFANNSMSVVGIAELNTSTDFLANSPEFSELMKSLSNSSEKFETLRKELIAKTGENIVLRRQEIWSDCRDNTLRVMYNHPGNKLAVIVEVGFTDNIAYNKYMEKYDKDENSFTNGVAMQIAAMAALVVSKNDLTKEMVDRQENIFTAQLIQDKKPESSWSKIIEGKKNKWYKDVVLLEQESIIIPKKTVDELRQSVSKEIESEIKILRFTRYELGDGLEKKSENFADEVNKLL